MKRFSFPLRPVALLRAHREARAREAFAGAVQALAQAEAAHTAARARLAALEATLTAARAGRFHAAAEADRLVAHRRECAVEAELARASAAARTVMEQRRAEAIEAYRQLEVVRRLETKARTDHRLAHGREEQAAFDELAARRTLVVSRLARAGGATESLSRI